MVLFAGVRESVVGCNNSSARKVLGIDEGQNGETKERRWQYSLINQRKNASVRRASPRDKYTPSDGRGRAGSDIGRLVGLAADTWA